MSPADPSELHETTAPLWQKLFGGVQVAVRQAPSRHSSPVAQVVLLTSERPSAEHWTRRVWLLHSVAPAVQIQLLHEAVELLSTHVSRAAHGVVESPSPCGPHVASNPAAQ
jgi:hypothetical protein